MPEMIKCRAMIEVLGKPKEHVEQALRGYIERITGDKNYQVFKSEVYDSEEKEDGFWVTFGELEFSAKDIPSVIGFCFDYMPSVIEILEPASLVMRDADISTFINDLQAKLHQVDMIAKQEKSEKIYLKQNLNNLMKNYVRVLLSKGPLTAVQMSKLTGVTQDNLEDFLDVLTDEKMIRMEGEYYHLEMSEIAMRNLPASARSTQAISEHAQEHAPGFSPAVLDSLKEKETAEKETTPEETALDKEKI